MPGKLIEPLLSTRRREAVCSNDPQKGHRNGNFKCQLTSVVFFLLQFKRPLPLLGSFLAKCFSTVRVDHPFCFLKIFQISQDVGESGRRAWSCFTCPYTNLQTAPPILSRWPDLAKTPQAEVPDIRGDPPVLPGTRKIQYTCVHVSVNEQTPIMQSGPKSLIFNVGVFLSRV